MSMSEKNSNFRVASGMWGRMILAGVMCMMLYLSMSVLASGIFSRTVGYQVAEKDAAGNYSVVETHRFTSLETEASIPEAGENQAVTKLTEVSKTAQTVIDILSLLMMLFLLGIFPYNILWDLGGKDDTQVRYKGKKPDPLRGLKIGLLATVPSAMLYAGLWCVKLSGAAGWYVAAYRILQVPFLPFINWMLGAGTDPAALPAGGVLGCALTLVVVPAVSAVAYRLGTGRVSVAEHLTYENVSNELPATRKRK